jgi:hypothetical protein
MEQIKSNAALARGKKAYFVGEFGFIPTKDIESLLQTVMDEKISGALIWSLRFHDRDGGFYWHCEPHGGDIYKAYHWPGFASGEAFDETRLLSLMRRKAFEIRGIPASPIEKPASPVLLDITDVAAISWRGSAGASGYNVERAENKDPASPKGSAEASGPWVVAGRDISDAAAQYRPLFNDTGAESGKSYYYRVIAANSAGASEPSNVIGPVAVPCKTLVDEMQDWRFIDKHSGKLSLETNQARKFKEDSHRLKGTAGSSVIYKIEAPVISWKVFAYFPGNISDFNFSVSADGQNFRPIKFSRHDYFTGKGDYNYYPPVLYTGAGTEVDTKFLKIEYTAEAQISRVEIKYGKP